MATQTRIKGLSDELWLVGRETHYALWLTVISCCLLLPRAAVLHAVLLAVLCCVGLCGDVICTVFRSSPVLSTLDPG